MNLRRGTSFEFDCGSFCFCFPWIECSTRSGTSRFLLFLPVFFSMSSTKFRSSLDIRSFSMELTVSSLDLHFSVRLSFFATNQMFHEVWNHFLDVGNVVDRRVWFIRVISSCASSRNGILKATKKTSVIIRATCCFQSVSLFHVRLLATLDLIGLFFFFQSHPSPSSSRKRCSFYRLSFLRRNREREREREREPSTKNRRPRTGTARLELLLLLFNCFFLVFQLPYPPESKKKKTIRPRFFPKFFFFILLFFFWSCPFPLLFCLPLHPRPLCPFFFFSILFYFFFVPDVSRYLAGWENAQFKFFVSYTQKKGPPINKMAPYFVSFSSGIVRVSFVFSIFLFFFFVFGAVLAHLCRRERLRGIFLEYLFVYLFFPSFALSTLEGSGGFPSAGQYLSVIFFFSLSSIFCGYLSGFFSKQFRWQESCWMSVASNES